MLFLFWASVWSDLGCLLSCLARTTEQHFVVLLCWASVNNVSVVSTSGRTSLLRTCSSASGTVRNQRFLLTTPDVLIRNHHLWLPVSFWWQRSSLRCRNSFLPIFTLSHYSILRKSLRFFTIESESLYTNVSREGKNTACYGSLLRCFSDKSSSKLTSPGVYRPWPTSLH